MAERFEKRKQHLQQMCADPEIAATDKNVFPMKQLPVAFTRLQWCQVPKVGTSFIKFQMQQELKSWKSLHQNEIKLIDKQNRKSFVFVREPYSRLISAYLGKVVTAPTWWRHLGQRVMKMSGALNSKSNWAEKCAIYATFEDFIKYFIASENTGSGRDWHIIPIHDQCGLCQYNYTFIGHLETFTEDLDFILRSVNISINIASQEEGVITRKAQEALDEGSWHIEQCTNKHTMMKKVWFSFQARGFIPESLELPISEKESLKITSEQFGHIMVQTWKDSKGNFDSKKQKRKIMEELYQQVSLKDRLTVQKILEKDFLLSQYNPQPPEVFPEFL